MFACQCRTPTAVDLDSYTVDSAACVMFTLSSTRACRHLDVDSHALVHCGQRSVRDVHG